MNLKEQNFTFALHSLASAAKTTVCFVTTTLVMHINPGKRNLSNNSRKYDNNKNKYNNNNNNNKDDEDYNVDLLKSVGNIPPVFYFI